MAFSLPLPSSWLKLSGIVIWIECIETDGLEVAAILKGHRQPQVFAGVQAIGAILCNTETSIS